MYVCVNRFSALLRVASKFAISWFPRSTVVGPDQNECVNVDKYRELLVGCLVEICKRGLGMMDMVTNCSRE